MPFEQTTEDNKCQLTKKQHFHMQAILKQFSVDGKITVKSKLDDSVTSTDSGDQCFIGRRSWSEEAETKISHPIEKQFIAQLRRIENSESICDHNAISRYHLLWCLRYHYAKNEAEDYDLYYNLPVATFNKETEEIIESRGKVPIRSGGKIAGRFKATHDIKQLLGDNTHVYKDYKWQVVKSIGRNFISADCYGETLVMAISPKFFIIGGKQIENYLEVTDEEVIEINDKSKEIAKEFYFGDE